MRRYQVIVQNSGGIVRTLIVDYPTGSAGSTVREALESLEYVGGDRTTFDQLTSPTNMTWFVRSVHRLFPSSVTKVA